MLSAGIRTCCLLLVIFLVTPAVAADFSRGVLWKISKQGTQASYVLGTIHSDDPSVTTLPAEVQHAFNHSRSFSAEVDMGDATMRQVQEQIYLPQETTLLSLVGQARYRQCVDLMARHGYPEQITSRMKPWAVAVQLSLPKPTARPVLDMKLYQMAKNRGLDIYALESIEQQLGIFDQLTTTQQITMLDEAMANFSELPDMIATLIEFYLQRNLGAMQNYSLQQMQKGDRQLASLMRTKLLAERNRHMVSSMRGLLIEGGAFIAIGALHLPGEDGVLNLLEEAGYSVESVY